MTWLFSLPGKIAMAALAGALLYGAGQWQGRTAANANAEARGAKATIEQLKERGMIDEAVDNTDLVDLCIELGGLPDNCRQ